jgi:hypothetical protein
MTGAEQKSLKTPDEVRILEKGKAETVKIGGGTVGRLTLEPAGSGRSTLSP